MEAFLDNSERVRTHYDEEIKERFYQDLDILLLSVPAEDKLIIMGDFNARVGQNRGILKGIIGKHGIGKQNSNGTLLLSECAKHEFAITNAFFQLPAKRHWGRVTSKIEENGTSLTTSLPDRRILRMST